MAAGLQFTLPGVPMVFAGDEIGLEGVNGEDARRPMPWHRPEAWDHDTLATYAALAAARRDHVALRRGGLRWAHVGDDTLAFLREHPEETLLVVARRAPGPPLDLPIERGRDGRGHRRRSAGDRRHRSTGSSLSGMALHVVASRPDPALLHAALVHAAGGVGRRARRPAPARPVPPRRADHPAPRSRLRGQGDARSRSRSASTGCCATCSGWACPAVVPQGVVTGRTDAGGEELPAALLTEHLRFSLPYRSLFSHGLTADNLPSLVDALVVLLVRLHLADFYWGDVSLSNVLFRRSAGGFAAYLVDAETGELQPTLSPRMREHDLTIATENVFAELLDLQASESLDQEVGRARDRRAARASATTRCGRS